MQQDCIVLAAPHLTQGRRERELPGEKKEKNEEKKEERKELNSSCSTNSSQRLRLEHEPKTCKFFPNLHESTTH